MAIENVDFPIEHGGSFHSYVSLPEGTIFTFWYFVGFFYIIFVHQKKSFRGLWCSIRHVSPGDFCVLRVECGPFPRRSATSDVRCAVWSATAPSSTRSLAPWRRASTWRSSRGSKGCRRADCTSTCCGDAMEWWNGVVDITLDMHVFAMVCAFSVFFAGWITSSFWSFRS